MRALVLAYGTGLLFGLGLVLSGMTQAARVVGFLDLAGEWDPSLAWVMLGAIAVHAVAYRVAPSLPRPWWGERWAIPSRRDIDARLIAGAALFGAGWGLGGYCPGPALTALAAGTGSTLLFTGSMLTGMWAYSLWEAASVAGPAVRPVAAPPDGSRT